MARELEDLLCLLIGLAVGLSLLGWYHIHITLKLKRLVQVMQPDALNWSFSSTSRLMRVIVAHSEEHQTLLELLETWKRINHFLPIGFLQVDQDNQLIWCNAKACQMLNIQPGQLPSYPRLLLEVVRSYELDQLIERTRAVGQPCEQEWTFNPTQSDPSILSQQSPCPLRGYAIPLADEQVGVFLENRQEAVALMQQRDRWISDVAHELKTPLTSIRLVAETLQMRVELPLRDWVDRLLKETIRLSTLVQDLLDLSQLEANRTAQLNLRTVDLGKLIQSTWLNLEPLARQKQIQFSYSSSQQILINADESKLHRAILNLLDNSIKYSLEDSLVLVQVSLLFADTDCPQVQIDIIDSGPGFPESALPHVFERFYRADPSRARSYIIPRSGSKLAPLGVEPQATSASLAEASSYSGSSGLGLAIVRQIVEAHGGAVKASNHPETHGAWVQIFLPYSVV